MKKMAFEVIPFNVFMAKGSVLSYVNLNLPIMEGYIFFGVLGAMLLGVTLLEKYTSVRVNETNIKLAMFTACLITIGWIVFKHPFFRHVIVGF